MVIAPNVNERIYRNKQFILHRTRKMHEHIKDTGIILKKMISTDSIPHLHPCAST